jgi:hypothetical protein
MRLVLEIEPDGSYEMRLEWPLMTVPPGMRGSVVREGSVLTFRPDEPAGQQSPFQGELQSPGIVLRNEGRRLPFARFE